MRDHLAIALPPASRRAAMPYRQIALRQTPRLDFRMVTGLFAWAIQNTVDWFEYGFNDIINYELASRLSPRV